MANKKPDIWMPLYVADYQADTAYLTTEQHGAYLLMLMAYWRNGPIPDNNGIIAAITRQSPDAWSTTRAVLDPFFQVREGFWFHKRVEQEYDKAKLNRSKAHDKAVAAAKARWEKERMLQALPKALPEHMPEQCPSPSPTQSTSKATSTTKEHPPIVPHGGQASADAPALTSDGKPGKSKAVGQRKAKQAILLTDWLAACKANGEQAIKPDDPIRQWAEDASIPDEYMRLAWLVFIDRYRTAKPQKDWPAHFRNAIRGNWLKLWYIDNEGECRLTTAGLQEQKVHTHG